MAEDEKPDKEVVEEQNVVETEPPEVEESSAAEASEDKKQDSSDEDEPKAPNIFKKFWAKYKSKKKISIPLTIVALLLVSFAVPVMRYTALGLFIRKDVVVTLVDSRSGIELSSLVTMDGKQALDYPRTFHNVSVGKHHLKTDTGYYKEFDKEIMVRLGRAKKQEIKISLDATGYTLSFIMHNKITGKAVEGLHIKSGNSETITDNTGRGSVVVDPSLKQADITVSGDGYNTRTFKQAVADDPITKFEDTDITPAGKVYFLSKLSGKIDVVKTDLDGGNRQTVLAGTGTEEDTNTVLLASRDWKYLALQSRRDNGKPKLYLIDTSTDKLAEMDSGDAAFTPIGWNNHFFVYEVQRNNLQAWQANVTALKSFNAENQQLATIDQTNAEGTGVNDYASEYIDSVYILKNTLLYAKHWSASYYSVYRLAGKRMGIYSVAASGANKTLLKDFDVANNGYINAAAAKPEDVYFSVNNAAAAYYEYEDGKLSETKDVTADTFSKFYPTYLLSPSGQATFWYEPRDGKNTLFTGTADGSAGKEVASLSEYIPYGWFGDDYLLVSKKSSELYILPTSGAGDKAQILKITDYHKPAANFLGYGGGYGGQ